MRTTPMERFQKRLRDNKQIAERNSARLEKAVRAACERLTKKSGRSVMIVACDKGGSSIFGQEYCTVGYTAAADGSLPEIDAAMEKMCAQFREELKKLR